MYVAGVLAVGSSGYRLWRSRRNLTHGVTYLCLAVVCIGLGAMLSAPATVVLTQQLEPFANATRLVANALACVGAFCVQALSAYMAFPVLRAHRTVGYQSVLLVVAIMTMTVLLASAPIDSRPDFVSTFADEPGVLGYVLVLGGYIACSLAAFIRNIESWIRWCDRPWLRRGLRVIQVGSVSGIGWAVYKSIAAIYVYATDNSLSAAPTTGFSAASIALIGLGATMPTWGPYLATPAHRWRLVRTYRLLRPLRDALVADVALSSHQPPRDVARAADERLAELVVEIRDGLLALAPYRAQADTAVIGSPDAETEAAEIVAALAARRAGVVPTSTAPPAPEEDLLDVTAETTWLRRVAREFVQQQRRAPERSYQGMP